MWTKFEDVTARQNVRWGGGAARDADRSLGADSRRGRSRSAPPTRSRVFTPARAAPSSSARRAPAAPGPSGAARRVPSPATRSGLSGPPRGSLPRPHAATLPARPSGPRPPLRKPRRPRAPRTLRPGPDRSPRPADPHRPARAPRPPFPRLPPAAGTSPAPPSPGPDPGPSGPPGVRASSNSPNPGDPRRPRLHVSFQKLPRRPSRPPARRQLPLRRPLRAPVSPRPPSALRGSPRPPTAPGRASADPRDPCRPPRPPHLCTTAAPRFRPGPARRRPAESPGPRPPGDPAAPVTRAPQSPALPRPQRAGGAGGRRPRGPPTLLPGASGVRWPGCLHSRPATAERSWSSASAPGHPLRRGRRGPRRVTRPNSNARRASRRPEAHGTRARLVLQIPTCTAPPGILRDPSAPCPTNPDVHCAARGPTGLRLRPPKRAPLRPAASSAAALRRVDGPSGRSPRRTVSGSPPRGGLAPWKGMRLRRAPVGSSAAGAGERGPGRPSAGSCPGEPRLRPGRGGLEARSAAVCASPAPRPLLRPAPGARPPPGPRAPPPRIARTPGPLGRGPYASRRGRRAAPRFPPQAGAPRASLRPGIGAGRRPPPAGGPRGTRSGRRAPASAGAFLRRCPRGSPGRAPARPRVGEATGPAGSGQGCGEPGPGAAASQDPETVPRAPGAPPWPRLWKERVRGRSRSAANAPWRRVSLRCPPGNAAAEVTDGRRCCSGGRPCCRPSSGLRRPVRGRPELPPADPGGCCPRGVGTFPVLRGAWSCCIGKCRWCRRKKPNDRRDRSTGLPPPRTALRALGSPACGSGHRLWGQVSTSRAQVSVSGGLDEAGSFAGLSPGWGDLGPTVSGPLYRCGE
ncbi:basic proline-rich protein-like [Mustela nigripes]|uniref:basic proline-rich protein-like n=1 Tax=Mustela nigripes TaxID=77151 RepID=UPI0028157ACC|nr:basic proline-rich protein-like [Mustela nigripes]